MLVEIGGKWIDTCSVVAVTPDRYGNSYIQLTTGKDIKIDDTTPDVVVDILQPENNHVNAWDLEELVP